MIPPALAPFFALAVPEADTPPPPEPATICSFIADGTGKIFAAYAGGINAFRCGLPYIANPYPKGDRLRNAWHNGYAHERRTRGHLHMSTAFVMGGIDFSCGKVVGDNPHPESDEQHWQWMNGWLRAAEREAAETPR
jgi:hypothetical protein